MGEDEFFYPQFLVALKRIQEERHMDPQAAIARFNSAF
jgi:hypothetical protein